MPQRLSAALVLISLCLAGTASAQSTTPTNGGDLPTLCDVSRFLFSSVSGDKDGEGDPERPPCPRGDDPEEGGGAPTPRPDPFMPEPPPIREQN